MTGTLADMGVRNYTLQIFRKQGCASAALNAATVSDYPSTHLPGKVAALFPAFSVRAA